MITTIFEDTSSSKDLKGEKKTGKSRHSNGTEKAGKEEEPAKPDEAQPVYCPCCHKRLLDIDQGSYATFAIKCPKCKTVMAVTIKNRQLRTALAYADRLHRM